jgi:hypothetical protein
MDAYPIYSIRIITLSMNSEAIIALITLVATCIPLLLLARQYIIHRKNGYPNQIGKCAMSHLWVSSY